VHFFIITVLIQIICVVHLIKSGANKLWLTAIIFLPFAGSAAYFLVEILPGLMGNKHMRHAKKKTLNTIDPDKDVRLARERLEITDSLANRIALADALAERDEHKQAIELYQEIIASPQGRDGNTAFKYASSLFQDGQFAAALEMLERLDDEPVESELNRRLLLRARILEHLDRDQDAADIFVTIVDKLSGIEPRCLYAALLLKMGRNDEARAQLQETLKETKLMDRIQIGDDQLILNWAKAELKKLKI